MSSSVPVALITGASRRIGAAIVADLHGRGFRIALHYHRSAEAAQRLILQLNAQQPDSVMPLPADLAQTADLPLLVQRVVDHWGRLDVLINNASAFFPTAVGSVTETDWNALLDSNLKAPFFLSQAAIPSLARQQGCIINLIDIYADRALAGHPVYSIAKAGLAALTRSLAVELAPEIRVNGIAPGAILWPEQGLASDEQAGILARIPLGRSGTPEDIVKAVRYLLDAPYVTGQILTVDGGRTLTI